MEKVFIVINSSGHIFGVYSDWDNAKRVFDTLALSGFDDLSLRTERVLSAAAHFPISAEIEPTTLADKIISRALSEHEIEATVEKHMNRLDKKLMQGHITQTEYDQQVSIVDKWAIQQANA